MLHLPRHRVTDRRDTSTNCVSRHRGLAGRLHIITVHSASERTLFWRQVLIPAIELGWLRSSALSLAASLYLTELLFPLARFLASPRVRCVSFHAAPEQNSLNALCCSPLRV